MSSETVAIAADHAGHELKEILEKELAETGVPALDPGTHGPDSLDYPDDEGALAAAIEQRKAARGILLCGGGIGIAANRHPELRAAYRHDTLTARLARQHNDANVLMLGARLIGVDAAKGCLDVFLNIGFE